MGITELAPHRTSSCSTLLANIHLDVLQQFLAMSLARPTRSAQSLLRAAQRASRRQVTSPFLARSYATVESDIFKPTKYGGKYTVTLIPGDGIGAEVAEAVKTVFKADNVPIEWEQVDVSGVDTGDKHSEELFQESIASLKRNKLGLKGILHTPIERSGHQSFNVALRQELDIYASVVLVKNIPGLKTRHDNVDLCIVRENTEGEYSGLEHQSVSGVVESLKIITRAKSERIAKFAFSFALANNRKKVTCIHKRNSTTLLCLTFTVVFSPTLPLPWSGDPVLFPVATWAVMSPFSSPDAGTSVLISRAKIKPTLPHFCCRELCC